MQSATALHMAAHRMSRGPSWQKELFKLLCEKVVSQET